MKTDFIHVHNHSHYSKFDGFASVSGLVKQAKEFGMRAVGLTDHGTFAGAIEFLRECRNNDIKPILGMEAYLARDHTCSDRTGQPDGRKGNRHLNVIAKNHTGYRNVCALSQESSLNGYYYDPRIDFELLSKHKEGVIVTSACLSSVVNWNLSIDRYAAAKEAVGKFQDIFGDDFYLEVMFHGIDAEAKIIPDIIKLSRETGVKAIATNDVHYINQEDAEYHEIVMCMSSNRCVRDPRRIKFPYKEFYFKSAEMMYKIFKFYPELLTNTIEIADKCNYSDIIFVDEPGGKMLLPKFDIPPEYANPYEYLCVLAWKGLKELGLDASQDHVDRLQLELDDIRLIYDTNRYDFSTYFLVVWDVMNWSRKNNIPAGIRGSGVASMLLKCLGISDGNIDPINNELIWERFLGFDSLNFFCDKDFGITTSSASNPSYDSKDSNDTQDVDPSSIMSDRYI